MHDTKINVSIEEPNSRNDRVNIAGDSVLNYLVVTCLVSLVTWAWQHCVKLQRVLICQVRSIAHPIGEMFNLLSVDNCFIEDR